MVDYKKKYLKYKKKYINTKNIIGGGSPDLSPENMNWIEYIDDSSGRPYWYNTTTGVTTLDNPNPTWIKYNDASGISSWHNTTTGETRWDNPNSTYGNVKNSAENITSPPGQTVTANNPRRTPPPVVPVLDPNRDTTLSFKLKPNSFFGTALPFSKQSQNPAPYEESQNPAPYEESPDKKPSPYSLHVENSEFGEEIDKLSKLYDNNFLDLDNQKLRQKFEESTAGRRDAENMIKRAIITHSYDLEVVEKVHEYYKQQHDNAIKLNKKLKKIVEEEGHEEHRPLWLTGIDFQIIYGAGKGVYQKIIREIKDIKAEQGQSWWQWLTST